MEPFEPEHTWRFQNLDDATYLEPDFAVSIYEYLALDRFESGLPDKGDDSHRPLMFNITPVHYKKDYRSDEKKASRKDKEFNKYGSIGQTVHNGTPVSLMLRATL